MGFCQFIKMLFRIVILPSTAARESSEKITKRRRRRDNARVDILTLLIPSDSSVRSSSKVFQ